MQRKTIRCLWTLGAVTLFVAMLASGCADSPTDSLADSPTSRQLEQAAQRGLEVIHNATVVTCPRISGHGRVTFPAGTEYDGFVMGEVLTFYKNKSDTLTIEVAPEEREIKYVGGKGVMKYKDKIFCFGF